MDADWLELKGIRQNNLKDISVRLPHDSVIVVTGVSGSGKSSLAFDTIFAEGQWRFIESLSSYARLFIEKLDRPIVDEVINIRPAIALDQRITVRNPRATIASITEIYELLRILYTRIASPHCPVCDRLIKRYDAASIISELQNGYTEKRATILFETFERPSTLISRGFYRIFWDNEPIDLHELPSDEPDTMSVIVDRIVIQGGERLSDSIELAWREGGGRVIVIFPDGDRIEFGNKLECTVCKVSLPTPFPALFSSNHPMGSCPVCRGSGMILEVDEPMIVSDIRPPIIENRKGRRVRSPVEGFKKTVQCPGCGGKRLNREALSYKVSGYDISMLTSLTIERLCGAVAGLGVSSPEMEIAGGVLGQLVRHLDALFDIGLGYLTADRQVITLSGGEFQRVRIAGQLAMGLAGTIYVLDEPTTGLHSHDNKGIISMIRRLADGGNTVIVVEHDPQVIKAADWVLELGAGGGESGGRVVFNGSIDEFLRSDTITSGYCRKGGGIESAGDIDTPADEFIRLNGASGNNLRDIDVSIPLNRITAISGVSGSGKSSLIIDTLYRLCQRHFGRLIDTPLPYTSHSGLESLRGAVLIDRATFKRSAQATPATAVKVFEPIRRLFARQREAKIYGYTPAFFSNNIEGGGARGARARVSRGFICTS